MKYDNLNWLTFPASHSAYYKEIENLKEIFPIKPTCVYSLNVVKKSTTRIFENDKNGILYIGQGDTTSRTGKLINSINGKEDSHKAGIRFIKLNFKSRFPYNKLELRISFPDDPELTEKQLLEEYEAKFGELPPLNRF